MQEVRLVHDSLAEAGKKKRGRCAAGGERTASGDKGADYDLPVLRRSLYPKQQPADHLWKAEMQPGTDEKEQTPGKSKEKADNSPILV